MKESYNRKTELQCITCGDSNFDYNDDKTWIRCNRCGKEYPGGYDELAELNQEKINRDVEAMKKEAAKDLQKDINKMLRKNFRK